MLEGALMVCAVSNPTHSAELDLVAVRKEIKGHIVQVVVSTPTPDQPAAVTLGSGFWIGDELVATCWHVVRNNPVGQLVVRSATDAMVDLPRAGNIVGNWEVVAAQVVAVDEPNDTAILKVAKSPFKHPRQPMFKLPGVNLVAHYSVAKLKSDLPLEGERALLAGYPLGQPYLIIQEGTVAALAFDLPSFGATNKILISSLANHGNSGAPIFNKEREVIGILQGENRPQGSEERTGISVVIPAYFVSELVKKIPSP
jgi:S1-C subfamily serine protease